MDLDRGPVGRGLPAGVSGPLRSPEIAKGAICRSQGAVRIGKTNSKVRAAAKMLRSDAPLRNSQ